MHIGARVAAEAGPGEVIVSRTVKDLVAGSRSSSTNEGAPAQGRARRMAALRSLDQRMNRTLAGSRAPRPECACRGTFAHTRAGQGCVVWAARIRFLTEARLEDAGAGFAPVTEGCVHRQRARCRVVHVGDEGRGVLVRERVRPPQVEFPQFGINVTVLEPGQSGVYHAESDQEAFLVLGGECRLLVEGDERRLDLGLLSLASLDGACVRGSWRQAVRDRDGRRPRSSGSALPGLGTRGALRRKRGRGDLRSGAGLCDGRAVPARAAAILVHACPGARAVRRKPRGTFRHACAPERHSSAERSGAPMSELRWPSAPDVGPR